MALGVLYQCVERFASYPVYVYVYVYIYKYIHIHIYIIIVYMCVCLFTYIYIYNSIHIYSIAFSVIIYSIFSRHVTWSMKHFCCGRQTVVLTVGPNFRWLWIWFFSNYHQTISQCGVNVVSIPTFNRLKLVELVVLVGQVRSTPPLSFISCFRRNEGLLHVLFCICL